MAEKRSIGKELPVTHPRIPCGTSQAPFRENELTYRVRMGMKATSWPTTWWEYDQSLKMSRDRE